MNPTRLWLDLGLAFAPPAVLLPLLALALAPTLAGVVAMLFVYLLVALLKPEAFE
jgi:K+-transporting ATPase KdpF subunit